MDGFITSRTVSDILSGLVSGCTIGLVAMSLVMIWRSTHILNFAQGAMATFATYLGMSLLEHHVGYWWCLGVSILAGFVIGGVTERVVVRHLYGKPELNPIVVMVGLLLVLESVMGAIWGTTPRPIPLPFSFFDYLVNHHPVALSPDSVFEIVAAALIALLVALLFRFTNLGLQLRAVAVAPEVSRLLGVRVSLMLTWGWVLSSGVAVLSAVIVCTGIGTGLTPPALEVPFAIAFVAATVGGLENPAGALFAGITLGMMQQLVSDYLNSNYVLLITLGILVTGLLLRPQGLFTKRVARRV